MEDGAFNAAPLFPLRRRRRKMGLFMEF